MASGPQLHCWRVSRARAAAGGTDGKDSSELRQGRRSKPHSPCRAGPFPSKNVWQHLRHQLRDGWERASRRVPLIQVLDHQPAAFIQDVLCGACAWCLFAAGRSLAARSRHVPVQRQPIISSARSSWLQPGGPRPWRYLLGSLFPPSCGRFPHLQINLPSR